MHYSKKLRVLNSLIKLYLEKFIRMFYCSSVNVCLLLHLTIQIRLNYWLRLHYFLTNKTLSNLSTEDDPLMITYHFLIVMPFLQFLTSPL